MIVGTLLRACHLLGVIGEGLGETMWRRVAAGFGRFQAPA